jgi:hypothetical protein
VPAFPDHPELQERLNHVFLRLSGDTPGILDPAWIDALSEDDAKTVSKEIWSICYEAIRLFWRNDR